VRQIQGRRTSAIVIRLFKEKLSGRRNISLLRSEGCLSHNPAIAVTEFWAIPKGATPPPSVESIRSSQAQLEVVRTEDTIKSAKGYRAALQQLAAKLRAKPEAAGVIVGNVKGVAPAGMLT
jgi:hypothetical protein